MSGQVRVNSEQAWKRLAIGAIVSLGCLAAAGQQVPRFEKIALIDNLDFGADFDIETPEGALGMIDHVCESHPTALAMRDKTGGKPRFASREEVGYPAIEPHDKRRICREDNWGWLKLDRDDFDTIELAFRECDRRGLTRMIHSTFEEAHWCIELISPWNFEHPQYWCRARGKAPWAGHCSLSFPEVREHRLRFLDETLTRKPEAVFLDFSRDGGWNTGYEYVAPVLARWKAAYGDEPPPRNAKDPRWVKLVEADLMPYLREFGRRCHAAGARFLVGFHHLNPETDEQYLKYAVDWRALAKDGTIDGLVAMTARYDAKDPYGAMRRDLGLLKAELGRLGRAKLYFHVSMYNYSRKGIPQIMKDAKESAGEVARKLVRLSKETGCAGVILECVDYRNYPKDVNAALAE